MVTAEKDIGGFQLDQKYFELPSVVRRDVGKSGNWPAHPNTMFVMDGIKPRITLPGSNQGGGKPAISNKRRGFSFSCHYTLPPFRFSTSHRGRRAAMLRAPSNHPPPKNLPPFRLLTSQHSEHDDCFETVIFRLSTSARGHSALMDMVGG